ncbi:MAG: DUF6625 family protein [Bacteroidota bacterium]
MPKEQQKITVLIPYFGKWPSYFNIYLESCTHNKWLNIIFFTDCEIPTDYPENVSFIPHTLASLSDLISKKLKRKFTVSYPYKLCDFKPCYGLIFEDYLKDSSYWGYSDIDLIYGDLKHSIFDRINSGFDVLSNRKEILSGSLAFFKNNDFLKNLYSQSSLFIEQLNDFEYKGLDETAHNYTSWDGGSKLDLPAHCFTYLVANEDKKGNIRASFVSFCKEYIMEDQVISYQNGILWFENTSIAYYHYVNNKDKVEYKLPNWESVPTSFFITSTGFYKNDKFYGLIRNYRKIAGFINHISQKVFSRITKK